MTDFTEGFRSLDRIEAPDIWPKIVGREPLGGSPLDGATRRWPTVAVALAASVITVAFVIRAFHGPSPGPRPVPAATGQGVWSSLARPIHPPTTAGGCPVTGLTTLRPRGAGFTGRAVARGTGPVYVAADPAASPAVALRPANRTSLGWYILKTLWVVPPAYRGPLLVRGVQLLGNGHLGFSLGTAEAPTLDQLELRTSGASGSQWWSQPTATFIGAPGCYAFQIDGTTFSEIIVFEAR